MSECQQKISRWFWPDKGGLFLQASRRKSLHSVAVMGAASVAWDDGLEREQEIATATLNHLRDSG